MEAIIYVLQEIYYTKLIGKMVWPKRLHKKQELKKEVLLKTKINKMKISNSNLKNLKIKICSLIGTKSMITLQLLSVLTN